MTQVASIQNFIIDNNNSTQIQQKGLGIAKKIKKQEKGCLCRQQKHKKIYKYISPEESDCDGWDEEDQFNRQSEIRRQNKEITDLQCVAWNLELFIKNAKQQLAYLEGTIQSTHSRN